MSVPTNTDDDISLFRMMLAAFCPILIGLLFKYLNLNIEKPIVIGMVRACIQLFLLGFVLLQFIFSMKSSAPVLAYMGAIVIMSTMEIVNRHTNTYKFHFIDTLISVSVGSCSVALITVCVIMNPTPWWDPKVFIPTAGMVIGSAMSGPAIGVERLLSSVLQQRIEIESRLAFGACDFEGIMPLLRPSLLAALMPTLNQLAIIGLVSIPGMMTGQLLSGTEPGIAAQYQMVISWMNCTSNLAATLFAMSLAARHAVFDGQHRLATNSIQKCRKEDKITFRIYTFLSSCTCISSVTRYDRLSDLACDDGSGIDNSNKNGVELDSVVSSYIANWTGEANPTHSSLEYLEVDESPDYTEPPILQLRNVNVLSGERNLFAAQCGLNMELRRGERVTLEGPSGLGKTRLLRAIAQLDAPVEGTLHRGFLQTANIDHDEVSRSVFSFVSCTMTSLTVPAWRSGVIYVPQAIGSLQGTPRSFLTECCGYRSRSRDSSTPKAVIGSDRYRAMERDLCLAEGKMDQQWSLLSGGERQRALIACALLLATTSATSSGTVPVGLDADNDVVSVDFIVLRDNSNGVTDDVEQHHHSSASVSSHTRPDVVLLLDEPTAACDQVTCAAVERAVVASGVAAIIVTHDEQQARRLAHRRIKLSTSSSI